MTETKRVALGLQLQVHQYGVHSTKYNICPQRDDPTIWNDILRTPYFTQAFAPWREQGIDLLRKLL